MAVYSTVRTTSLRDKETQVGGKMNRIHGVAFALRCVCYHMLDYSGQLCALKKEWRLGGGSSSATTGSTSHQLESEDLKKIKKVQSFFRGWLCRRRWKQIVDEYIKSPHAEAMRKRNRWFFPFTVYFSCLNLTYCHSSVFGIRRNPISTACAWSHKYILSTLK